MQNEYPYQELRTYAAAWRLERVIYRIENFTLPFPVSYDQLTVFLCVQGLVVLLRTVPGLDQLMSKWFFWHVLLPVGATWYLTRVAVDGKNPLLYVWARLRHWVGPKRLYRYREYGLPWWQRRRFHFMVEIRNNLPTAFRKAVRRAGR